MSQNRASPSGPFALSGVASLLDTDPQGVVTVLVPVPVGAIVLVTRATNSVAHGVAEWAALGVFVPADRKSFTITCKNGADTSDIDWIIL
jgi:hypothetical protein